MAADEDLKKRVRRHRRKRFYHERRFILGVVIALLLALVVANGYYIFGRSPGRMKVRYLQDGFRAYDLGNYEVARLNFESYVRIDPNRANMWFMLGLSRLRIGHGRSGVQALEEAIRLSPGFTLAHTALSDYWRRQGQLLLALKAAERATDASRSPIPEDAWVALGEARLALGEVEGAIDAFRRAVRINPSLIETLLKLADLYFSRERLGLEDVSAGLARRRYEEAAQQAQRLLSANPADVQARVWSAKASAGQGFLADAQADLERVVDLEPKVAAHRLLLARFQEATQNYEDAAETLREAWDVAPTPEIAIRHCRILTDRLGEPEEGRAVLERGIERFPEESSLYIALLAHHSGLGRADQAREVLTRALAEFPGDSLVLEAAGDLARKDGDREGAVRALRDAVEAFDVNLSARRKLIGLLLEDYLDGRKRGDPVEELRAELDGHLAFFLDDETGVNPTDLLARSYLARLFFAEGRFEEAARLLDQEGGGVPRSYEGLKILALARLSSGQYVGASDAFFAALRHPSSPQSFDDYNLAYTTAFRIGLIPREVEIARSALRRWPTDADWHIRLATSLYRGGSYPEAVEECELAKTLLAGQRDVRPHLLAARIHQALGETARARNELEEAVLLRRDAETRGALYTFLAETGDEKLGEEGFRALLEENPSESGVFLDFGDFLLSRSRSVRTGSGRDAELREEALKQYQIALTMDPDSREALRRVAELRMAQAGNKEEAVAVAEAVVAKLLDGDDEDPQSLYFKGKLHLLKEEYAEALTSLAQYARSRPNDPAGHYYLAIALRRTGDLERAKESFLAALGLDPSMVEAQLELATLYFSQGIRAHWNGELESARTSFEKVNEIDPRQPDAHLFMAETLAGLGMLEAAAEHAERVLEEKPDDPGALFLSGLFLANRGDLEEAQQRFEHLVSVAPENSRSHLHLGMILAERKMPDAALISLRRSYELEPEGDEVLRAIVLTELSAERLPKALQFLEAERDRTPQRAFTRQLLGELYLRAGRPEEAIESCLRAF